MELGFKRIENFLGEPLVTELERILRKFHQAWLVKNQEFYLGGAINSAYITGGEFLESSERLSLFKLISSKALVAEAKRFLGDEVCFLNTQIFFNPSNPAQKNYWHRDIQYTGTPEADQRKTVEARESQVLHLRIAFADEPGLEFVPGSHFKWDSPETFEVRTQQNGKISSDSLSGTQVVPLNRSDLLVFDANIIHRGLYGLNRFAFDILFCKPDPKTKKFARADVFPKQDELKVLECPEVFSWMISSA